MAATTVVTLRATWATSRRRASVTRLRMSSRRSTPRRPSRAMSSVPNRMPNRSPNQIGRAHGLNSSHLGISYAVFCLKKNKAVVDFVWSQPHLRPYGNPLPATAASAAPDAWAAVGLTAALADNCPRYSVALGRDEDQF